MAEQAQPVVNKREDLEMAIDLHYINTQLKERDMTEGAFSQDYHNFLSIYRFLERVLVRTDLRVQLILLTLTDRSGTFVDLNQREELMEKVRDSICVSLRLSDIYTIQQLSVPRYGSECGRRKFGYDYSPYRADLS